MWQNEPARKELWRELQQFRQLLNRLAGPPYEPWQVICVSAGVTLILVSIYSFLFREDETLWSRVKKTFFRSVRKLPFVRAKIDKGVKEMMVHMEKSMISNKSNVKHRTELPEQGIPQKEVIQEIDELRGGDLKWPEGWVSGALYNCSAELTDLTVQVFGRFVWANPLHPDVFPSVRKMEAEVVQWCVGIFNGGKEACGLMTSGGTESILMAMKAYREVGYSRGIRYPEIVCPLSAHSAFLKAANYFKMKITQVSVDPQTRMVNLKAMARAISKNTVVLVGSAPHFPHGIIDPIEDIAALARKNGIGCHVDCCLGGFLVPFIEKAGFEMAPFDFRAKGVTTISADTHKYGYATKGTSVLLYANKDLRHKQYFVDTNWQGGVYCSPSVAGSRAGSLIAATWATMLYMGMNGYIEATKAVITTTRKIIAELRKVPGIYILGSPKVSVVAIGSKDFDIFRLFSAMKKKGWNLNGLQYPPAFHICITMVHTKEGIADRFIGDIQEETAEIMKQPKAKTTGYAALYGAAQEIPDRSVIEDIANGFLDLCYKAGPPSAEV